LYSTSFLILTNLYTSLKYLFFLLLKKELNSNLSSFFALFRSAKLYEITYKENIKMKKLKEELFINVEKGYGRDLKEKFKKVLFDISLAIIKDEYLDLK
jgi:hypothetical protein